MKLAAKLLLGVVLSLAASESAGAAIMQMQWSGTIVRDPLVGRSYDRTNEWGYGQAFYVEGKPFTLTITYDTNMGVREGDWINLQQIEGGDPYPVASPFLGAVFNIDGIETQMATPYGLLSIAADGLHNLAAGFMAEDDAHSEFRNFNIFGLGPLGGGIGKEYAGAVTQGYGGIRFYYEAKDTHQVSADAFARLLPTYVSVSVITPDAPTPVPEPGSWALLIAGFGLMGARLRAWADCRRFA